jgi:hypothetical protein
MRTGPRTRAFTVKLRSVSGIKNTSVCVLYRRLVRVRLPYQRFYVGRYLIRLHFSGQQSRDGDGSVPILMTLFPAVFYALIA